MSKRPVINGHKMQRKGKRPHRPAFSPADVARIEAMDKLGNEIADVKQELPLLRKDIEGMIDRDRLLTAQRKVLEQLTNMVSNGFIQVWDDDSSDYYVACPLCLHVNQDDGVLHEQSCILAPIDAALNALAKGQGK